MKVINRLHEIFTVCSARNKTLPCGFLTLIMGVSCVAACYAYVVTGLVAVNATCACLRLVGLLCMQGHRWLQRQSAQCQISDHTRLAEMSRMRDVITRLTSDRFRIPAMIFRCLIADKLQQQQKTRICLPHLWWQLSSHITQLVTSETSRYHLTHLFRYIICLNYILSCKRFCQRT